MYHTHEWKERGTGKRERVKRGEREREREREREWESQLTHVMEKNQWFPMFTKLSTRANPRRV